jgi:hypothetical protein
MKKIATFVIVFAAAVSVVSMAQAQTKTLQTRQSTAINDLKAASGNQKLKCTGATGHKTCTSKYAWVCPKGWNACTPPSGGTCCTQN